MLKKAMVAAAVGAFAVGMPTATAPTALALVGDKGPTVANSNGEER
ncbi:hypothetical protein [Streptomyces sp. NBC_00203]